MFGFGGTSKTRGQLAKEEFGVGFDHIRQAATLAAGGVGSAVGPRAHAVRSMITPAAGRVRTVASSGWDSTVGTLVPLMAAAREGAREATEAALKAKAKEMKRRRREEHVRRRRIGLALGLLAAGTAVGAAAALVIRRRRRSGWEEYDASEALESMMDSAVDRSGQAREKAAAKAGDLQGKGTDVSKRAGDALQTTGEKTGDAAQRTAGKAGDSGRDMAEETGAYAGDLNSKVRRS